MAQYKNMAPLLKPYSMEKAINEINIFETLLGL